MKKLTLLCLCFCFFSLPLQGQDPISALRALNEKVGAVTDPFYKDQLDYLVDCIDDATFRDLPFTTLEKLLDAYLCHLEYLASHTPADEHLPEGRQIINDLAIQWFLFLDLPPAPVEPDPPPVPKECTVRIYLVLGDSAGFSPNGKFHTSKHRQHMYAEGDPGGGTYTWTLEPSGLQDTGFVTGGNKATVISFRKGTLKAKVVYKVGAATCESMLEFDFR